jgi:hypothetical protein
MLSGRCSRWRSGPTAPRRHGAGAHDGHLVDRHAARAHPVGQGHLGRYAERVGHGDPGHAGHKHGRHGHPHWAPRPPPAMASDCSSAPRSTSASRGIRWRSCCIDSAATMAPAPMEASSSVKVPAPPPFRPRATSGSSASSAVECRRTARCAPARPAGGWTAARTAAPRAWRCSGRSRPSGLRRVHALPAHDDEGRRHIDSRALSTNTQALPALAISAPATSGPMMRDAFMDTPLSASAAGSWMRGTSSGHDGRKHRPAHGQADAVGKGQRQQQRRVIQRRKR